MIQIALCVLVLAFVAGNVVTEVLREREPVGAMRLSALRDPISNYLRGPDSRYQVWGFGALALACVAYGLLWSGAWIVPVLMFATAGGLVFVVLTKRWTPIHVLKYHLIASGFAFIGATLAEFAILWGTPLVAIPFLALVSATLFARFAPAWGSIEEKAYALIIVIGFFASIAAFR